MSQPQPSRTQPQIPSESSVHPFQVSSCMRSPPAIAKPYLNDKNHDENEPYIQLQPHSEIYPNSDQVNLSNQQQVKHHRVIGYRPDIDGIRAIAILLVLTYHAFPDKLTGGFIGVDVFFVISGFLITQIIVKEITLEKFSIINFYFRRIKRIYPALILVMCLALWVTSEFVTINLATFSIETLQAALIFCANFKTMLHKDDYFVKDVRSNPLLHLWSLGVEEQFYIIWPFLIVFILTYWKKKSLSILSIFTVFSFILSVFAVFYNKKFAFYFPLCRFWQMAIGGILGYANFSFRNTLVNNVLSVIGFMTIIISSVVIDYQMMFPGFWALMPSLGCACIIQSKNQAFINKYILSSAPMTFIGKISYGLYLWHWPLMVYSKIPSIYGSTSILANIYLIIALSFGLSVVTYFVVENPIRTVKTKKIAIILIVLMGIVGIASVFVQQKIQQKYSFNIEDPAIIEFLKKAQKQMTPGQGDFVMINGRKQPNFSFNKNRILPTDINQVRVQNIQLKYEEFYRGEVLQKSVDENSSFSQAFDYYKKTYAHNSMFNLANDGKDNKVFLVGDSHLFFITFRFQELFKRAKAQGTLDKFPTVVSNFRFGNILSQENPVINLTRQLVRTSKPKRILFAWNWIYYFCKDIRTRMDQSANCNLKYARQKIGQYIRLLKQLSQQGIEVYSMGVAINNVQYMPEYMFNSNGIINEHLGGFKYSDYRRKYREIYELVEGSLKERNISMIDAANSLCWQDHCDVVSPKGYAAFKDEDHMGKLFVANWLGVVDHLVEF